MTASVAIYAPTFLGYGFDVTARALSKPSALFLGKASFGGPSALPIWTTQYIFAMNYISKRELPSKVHVDELKHEMNRAKWIARGHLALRVLWAASIVLPVLAGVALLCKAIAGLDPAIRLRYEDQKATRAQEQREKELIALGLCVQEFAYYLMATGCKEELDEAMPLEQLQILRAERFRHFSGNYRVKDAVLKSSELILDLLHRCYQIDLAAEGDLKVEISRIFRKIKNTVQEDASCEWMKGEKQSVLYPAWTYLIEQHESFNALCQSS